MVIDPAILENCQCMIEACEDRGIPVVLVFLRTGWLGTIYATQVRFVIGKTSSLLVGDLGISDGGFCGQGGAPQGRDGRDGLGSHHDGGDVSLLMWF